MYVAAVIRITKGGTEIVCVDIIQVGRQDPSLSNTIGHRKWQRKRITFLDSKFLGSVAINQEINKITRSAPDENFIEKLPIFHSVKCLTSINEAMVER